MPLSAQEQDLLIREGVEALRQGRAADARMRFERLTAAGSVDPLSWLLLAISRRTDRDLAGEEAALDRLLDLDPRSVRGLIMKADCRLQASDRGAARQFYRTAIKLADVTPLTPDAVPEVQRAREALAELESHFHAKREALLASRGVPPEGWSPRFRHALELAAGRRRQFVQQPTVFTYPELPHIQFYDREGFEWAPAVEAATDEVRAELQALLKERGTGDFRPYIQADPGQVRLDANKDLADNRDWSALFLVENGQPAPAVLDRCPRTWEAVSNGPLASIPGWGPTVMFSLLKAGARIAPHTGMFNTRLVCHLPLIVPKGCRFRVGNEIREWNEGKLLIFDDTIEHEAWNDSTEDRVVLIFDIWRPELSEQERRELTALFATQ
jgi:aspartyl/asparaginyl beta-hydroxylase (cupin superfamily)